MMDLLLNDEGHNALPAPGVVGELLLVVAVFADGPHGHLVEATQREQGR